MSYPILVNTAVRPLVFKMVDSTSRPNGKTGLSPTVTLSKNGGSFAAAAGAVSEIGSGLYKVAPNITDANTVGPLFMHATAAGADPWDDSYEIVSYDPYDAVRLGLSALPNATAGQSNGLLILGVNSAGLIISGSTFGVILTSLSGNAFQADNMVLGSTDLMSLLELLRADLYVDTGHTPWQLVHIKKGTGGLGVGTELLRQNLSDVNGTNLTSAATVVGREVSP